MNKEGCNWDVEVSRAIQQERGTWYTPDPLVHKIIDLLEIERAGLLFSCSCGLGMHACFRICDPTCGKGVFLAGFLERFAQHFFCEFHCKPTFDNLVTYAKLHLFGIDIERNSIVTAAFRIVYTARKQACNAQLISEQQLEKFAYALMLSNFRVCDLFAVAAETIDNSSDCRKVFGSAFFSDGSEFDCLIGNPPFNATLSPELKRILVKRLKIRNPDSASLTLAIANYLAKPSAIKAFVVPKSLLFASNWQTERETLLNSLVHVVDAGKIWHDVKIETVAIIADSSKQQCSYVSHQLQVGTTDETYSINKENVKQFGNILTAVPDAAIKIAKKMAENATLFGSLVENQRGFLLKQIPIEPFRTGLRPVISGRDVRLFGCTLGVRGVKWSHEIPLATILRPGDLLVQNIVSHLTKPQSHIRLLACSVGPKFCDSIPLDTVNVLRNFSIYHCDFLLGVLLSSMTSWYLYNFIFARAVRTMHFDRPVSDRLPCPNLDMQELVDARLHDRIMKIVAVMRDISNEQRLNNPRISLKELDMALFNEQIELDRAVSSAFRLSEQEWEFIAASFS